MEISLNTGNVPDPTANQSVVRKAAVPTDDTSVSFSGVDALKSALNDINLVRPEKVAQARALVADEHYPPTVVLDRIASLLAIHLKK